MLEYLAAGRRHTRGRKTTLKAKTLRRMLKKKGMKTTGKKATLMKRLHMRGGSHGLETGPATGLGDSYGGQTAAGNSPQPSAAYAGQVASGLPTGGRRRRTRGRGY